MNEKLSTNISQKVHLGYLMTILYIHYMWYAET